MPACERLTCGGSSCAKRQRAFGKQFLCGPLSSFFAKHQLKYPKHAQLHEKGMLGATQQATTLPPRLSWGSSRLQVCIDREGREPCRSLHAKLSHLPSKACTTRAVGNGRTCSSVMYTFSGLTMYDMLSRALSNCHRSLYRFVYKSPAVHTHVSMYLNTSSRRLSTFKA